MKRFSFFIFLCILFGFTSENRSEVKGELVNISDYISTFEYEMRYATPNNFIGEVLYDCEVCLLEEEVAEALVAANDYFCELGYRIKIYDCYRPLDVQKKMWEKVPRSSYVGNPYGNGSIHNKAAAVDITLVTLEGCYVEMASDYDFFGIEAHIDNYHFSEEILENRKLLIDGMRRFGFNTIRTEWWHFSYKQNWRYKTRNEPLPCS